jgi:SnoaL-like domain
VNDQSIEKRLMAVEDRLLILDTLQEYCHAFDYGDSHALRDCFVDDAVWYWTVKDSDLQAALQSQGFKMVGTFEEPLEVGHDTDGAIGREQLSFMAAAPMGPPTTWTKHSLSNVMIKIANDEATSNCYYVVTDASKHSTGSYLMASGRYQDKLVRCADGKWRIKWRMCDLDTSYYET